MASEARRRRRRAAGSDEGKEGAKAGWRPVKTGWRLSRPDTALADHSVRCLRPTTIKGI